jgi:hypothetical protein
MPVTHIYAVFHLDPKKQHKNDPLAEVTRTDNGHTITMILDEKDRSKDELYVDSYLIHPNNWKYKCAGKKDKRTTLQYLQHPEGPQKELLFGLLAFKPDHTQGKGIMRFGSYKTAVDVAVIMASYMLDQLSNSALAYYSDEERDIVWINSDDNTEWEDADWNESTLLYEYGFDINLEMSVKYTDLQSDPPAEPYDVQKLMKSVDHDEETGDTVFIIYEANMWPPPPAIPIKMKYVFGDTIGYTISEGATIHQYNDYRGTVYGIKGHSVTKALVGTFNLQVKGKKAGVLEVHPKALTINGKSIKEFIVRDNKVTWSADGGGFVEFSKDKRQITSSSIGATGVHYVNSGARSRSDADLNVDDLLNMYPYDDEGDDEIQAKAMEDFYILIQYFMPQEYIDDFFGSRPTLDGYLRLIAEDDNGSGENEAYYLSLSIPYLAYWMSGCDKDLHPDVVHLNYIRSDNFLKSQMQTSEVFNRHSGKMYRHHWRQKFTYMDDYLDDQEKTDYTNTINTMTEEWVDAVKENMENVLEQEQLDSIIQYCRDCGQKAIDEKCYWAYAMFRDLTSIEYILTLHFLISVANGDVDDLIRQHEQYCSTMCILDVTSYFANEFSYVLDVCRLTMLIPDQFDPSQVGDMSSFAQMVAEEFADMYTNNPDEALAEAAEAIKQGIEDFGWQRLLPILGAAGELSLFWKEFAVNSNYKFIEKLGSAYGKLGTALAVITYLTAITFVASGMIDWNDLTALQQAELIVAAAKGTAFFITKGFSILNKYMPGWWENVKHIFYKTRKALAEASQRVTSAFAMFIVKHFDTSKLCQGLKVIEAVGDEYTDQAFKQFDKFGGKMSKNIGLCIAGLFAVVDSIICAIEIAHTTNPTEIAMHSLFLLSSVAEIVSIAAEFGVARGSVTIGGYLVGKATMTTIATVATGLSIACAVAGFIVMIVLISTNKEPPDPIRDFCNSSEVAEAGLYMDYNVTIEYFAVQMDDEEESEQIGITMTGDGSNYMYVNDDGTLKVSQVEYTYRTVYCVATDAEGIADFFTKIVKGDSEQILHLTVDDKGAVVMLPKYKESESAKIKSSDQQMWITECTGNVKYTDKEQLESASFTILNKSKNVYLYYDGKNIVTSSNPQNWTIELEYMQPAEMNMRNITLTTMQRDKVFNTYLAQPGSTSKRSFSLDKALPDWLVLDKKIGSITQKTATSPPLYSATQYTMTAKNDFGKTTAKFTIEVIESEA